MSQYNLFGAIGAIGTVLKGKKPKGKPYIVREDKSNQQGSLDLQGAHSPVFSQVNNTSSLTGEILSPGDYNVVNLNDYKKDGVDKTRMERLQEVKWIVENINNIPLSELHGKCEELLGLNEFELAHELVVLTEKKAEEIDGLSRDQINALGFLHIKQRASFGLVDRYGIVSSSDTGEIMNLIKIDTMEKLSHLSRIMNTSFSNDSAFYYYILILMNSYISLSGNSATEELFKIKFGEIINIRRDRPKIVSDFIESIVDYLRHKLNQELSGNRDINTVERIQKLAKDIINGAGTLVNQRLPGDIDKEFLNPNIRGELLREKRKAN